MVASLTSTTASLVTDCSKGLSWAPSAVGPSHLLQPGPLALLPLSDVQSVEPRIIAGPTSERPEAVGSPGSAGRLVGWDDSRQQWFRTTPDMDALEIRWRTSAGQRWSSACWDARHPAWG